MNNIRQLRIAKSMSMKQLGVIVGVAESTISLYETEKRQPDTATIFALADYFDVSIDYLLGRNEAALPIISTKEIEMIKKYRALNEHGKQSVEALLNFEYSKSTEILKIVARDGNTQFIEVDSRTLDEELEKLKNIKPRTDL